jgi:membrane protease subunit HflC
VERKVFERMISERKRIAERSRSEGQGRAAEIFGQKERDVLAATSVGYKQAQAVKGAADDQFLKSMETLDRTLDSKSWLVLATDSDLLKYLRSAGGP